MKFLTAVLLIAISFSAEARVFSFGKESFAPYIRGTFGAAVENTLIADSNTDATNTITMDEDFAYSLSGELGLVYTTSIVGFRFGIELYRPPAFEDRPASNAAGEVQYNLKSEVTVLIPKFTVDVLIKQWPRSRLLMSAGVGSASLTGKNTYEMTAEGTTTYGKTSFSEDLKATSLMYEADLGYEFVFADATTLLFEAGYRMLKFDEIKHHRETTNFTQTVVSGDVAVNTDGSKRSLDLSGPFVGLSFRWWIR